MSGGRTHEFCPHLSFRLSFRHKRISEKNQSSEENTSAVVINNSANIDLVDHETVHKSPEVHHEGSGEPADLPTDINKRVRTTSIEKVGSVSPRNDGICQECELAGIPSAPRSLYHLWRCLEPKCKLLLCGKQGHNHSQLHCQEYPTHVLQENDASKRIWCNECNHEVFPDHRNRRTAPAVWSPLYDTEGEPPRGLFNIGNTCFMNAALQCMAAVKPLNSYFLGQSCNLKGKNVGSSYLWLLSELWAKDLTFSKGVMPSRLLHAVRAAHPIFRGFQQHDTQEFLRLFMDTLAEETRIPHFILDESEEAKQRDTSSEDGTTTSDSETESFETCDSGNASEETDVHSENQKTSMDGKKRREVVKVILKSVVSEIFDGQIESSAQCLSCKQVSSRLEVFQDLSLPIPTRDELMAIRTTERFECEEGKNHPGWVGWIWEWMKSFFWGPCPTLEDCFAAFFSTDELKGKNMYSCEKCQKLRNGVKRCSLFRLPEILCIHLKRFRMYEYSGGMGFSGKVSQYVHFPLDGLDLSPFLNKDCTGQVTTYRLMGAICHIGSFLGGHYTAYIRRDDQWYLCDDSRVVIVSPETVAECEAYVLFYQKHDVEDTTKDKQDLIDVWDTCDEKDPEEMRYHLISRKWLTQFLLGEEAGPIDNSDVVCPHGYVVPFESVHFGATWVPHPIWEMLIERCGGGPDLLHHEECVICSATWRKHLKSTHSSFDRDRRPRMSVSES